MSPNRPVWFSVINHFSAQQEKRWIRWRGSYDAEIDIRLRNSCTATIEAREDFYHIFKLVTDSYSEISLSRICRTRSSRVKTSMASIPSHKS